MHSISTDEIKEMLLSEIDSLLDQRELFLTNPKSDFTRTKKISFEQTVIFPMIAASNDIATELLDYIGEQNLPMPSAMIQRRNQIKPEAFKALFSSFTKKIPVLKDFLGYQLLACDGSRINLPYHPSDTFSFIKCIKGRKGVNQVHLNALYDIQNDIFIDASLQGIHNMNEQKAFCEFLDNHACCSKKRIYIADRGYASYNIFGHAIHNNQLFLIRAAQSKVEGFCPNDKKWLEDKYVDREITVTIGRCRGKSYTLLENYHYMSSVKKYDFISPKSKEVDVIKLRVLKFPISDNSYEYVVTNLPKYSFSIDTIKRLYNLRWNEETAFRHLKYAGNMVHIHSLKQNLLVQEIYAKLTLYNFSSFISLSIGDAERKTEKYLYVKNHTQVQKLCLRFIKGKIEDIKTLILRCLVPVRPGRKFARNLRRQAADSLNYR